MHNFRRQWLAVLGVAALVLLTNLGGPRLWDRDEPRNAGCAREMLERGDWIVPTFNAELRTHKPVLLYWLMMSVYSVFGVSEFTARLPSALCGITTCLATYAIGRRLFSGSAAVWAGVALATSLMFVVAGRAATPDATLICCTTLALAIYVCGTFLPLDEQQNNIGSPSVEPALRFRTPGYYFPQSLGWCVALYAAMGFAVLAKGPVGLVLPTAVIGMFLLIMRLPPREPSLRPAYQQRVLGALRPFAPLHFLKTCWQMRPLLAIGVATAIALPWYAAVGWQTNGEFLRGFFFEHNLQRATQPMEGHDGGPLFYPAALLIGCFPWSILALPLVWDVVRRLRAGCCSSPAIVLCLCWIGVYVGLFSLAGTKLPSYITPCYPAAALLVGSFVDRWRRGAVTLPAWTQQVAFGTLIVAGVAMLVALPIVARKQLPGDEWLALIGLAPLLAGVIALIASMRGQRGIALGSLTWGAVATMLLLFAVATEYVDRHQHNDQMLAHIAAAAGDSTPPRIAAYRDLEPTWVFYGQQPIRELHRILPKADDQQSVSPAEASRLTRQQAVDFLQQPDAFLIATSRRYEELKSELPPDTEVVSDTPLFLKKDRLLVLHRRTTNSTAAAAAKRTTQR